MNRHVAIVGSGPMGVYCFHQIMALNEPPAQIVIIEKGETAGIGTPYSSEASSKWMLANIASIEIPPLGESYLQWLRRQNLQHLKTYGLDPATLHDRQFTPRLLLGEYFRDQFQQILQSARSRGIEVIVKDSCEVIDVEAHDDLLNLLTASGEKMGPFDKVVLATGHSFPADDEATDSYFPSPWSGLIKAVIPACNVGILGTSLSAIDAAMAVAVQHGQFQYKQGRLVFETNAANLKICMMSWTGVLPEADFYCPIPYEPLTIMTDFALRRCLTLPQPLDGVFDLVRQEILLADPGYASNIGLVKLSADNFYESYFAARKHEDPFNWAKQNLDEVETNKALKITVPWRYALIRMHEQVETIVADMSEADRARFDKGLKPVFVDNYAAVPSESIRRILALHDANVLSVLALGEDYELQRKSDETIILANGAMHYFDVFIDARGQRPLTTNDLPFPSLRESLLKTGHEHPELANDYSVIGTHAYEGKLILAAIPYLMHDRPFVQGITACSEIAEAITRGFTIESNVKIQRRRWMRNLPMRQPKQLAAE